MPVTQDEKEEILDWKIWLAQQDLLLMSIPNCGKSYFLLIQQDVDFKPLSTMLQSHQDSTGCHHIFRFKKKFDI